MFIGTFIHMFEYNMYVKTEKKIHQGLMEVVGRQQWKNHAIEK